MARQQEMVFRPTAAPGVATPIGARSVGHYRWDAHEAEGVMQKPFAQIFWCIDGRGALGQADGTEVVLQAGQLGLYLPGDTHRVFSLDRPFEYRWWTLDGPLARQTTEAFGLTHGRAYSPGPAPDALFDSLEQAIRHVTPDGERRAATLAFELLAWAAGGASPDLVASDPQVAAAVDVLHRHWSDPAMNVTLLARQLDTHRSSLSRRFRQVMGVPPVTYLTGLRIQHALTLLKQTDLSIADVAASCGFDDPNYFARAIRHATGLSPRAFRLA